MTLLRAYSPVCDAVADLLAPHAEVVLHDLAEQRIAYIANSFSKRRAGDSSLTDPELTPSLTADVIGPYPKTNWDGRSLKSITAVLRDGRRRPIGLLCVNYDVSAVAEALEHLTRLLVMPKPAPTDAALLSQDWREGVNATVGSYLKQRKTTLEGLTGAELDELLGLFLAQGIFDIRNAVSYVTAVLNVSRANVYKRLSNLRPRKKSQRSQPCIQDQ